MAQFQALQNSPISVNLLAQAKTTGWSILTPNAVHELCNAGNIILTSYPVTAGISYSISYIINSISGGNCQVQSPGSNGGAYTTPGLKVDTINPTSNGFVSIYSNASANITAFTIQPISNTPGTTIVYSAINQKWSDFRTYYPSFGWSLFTRTIVGYQGNLYQFENGNSSSTNNFFGTAFQSLIQFVEAKNSGIIKDFEAISYQANMLLVTPMEGVQSSNGQVTTLIDTDFIKQKLASPGESLILYNVDNVYSASFLGDENEDIVNGTGMRGNYLIVGLQTVDGSTPLILFSINVRVKTVFIGARPL